MLHLIHASTAAGRRPEPSAGVPDQEFVHGTTLEPEVVELSGGPIKVPGGRSVAWLGGWLGGLAVVVGLAVSGGPASGLRVGESDAVGPPASPTPAPSSVNGLAGPASVAATIAQPAPVRHAIVVLLPGSGDVVVADAVPVAGMIAGPRPGRSGDPPTSLHLVITAGDVVLGQVELPVLGGRFAGAIPVVAPARGQVVELRIADPGFPGRSPTVRAFVLRAPEGHP